MSDTDGKKPLGLGGTPRSGSVKQSFSHGRTHAVVVETKRKRVVVPAAKPAVLRVARLPGPLALRLGDPSKRPAGISDAEMERRLAALRSAKAREQEEAAKRAADEKERDEDRQRRREEIEAKDREDRAREAALRAHAEEEERAEHEAAPKLSPRPRSARPISWARSAAAARRRDRAAPPPPNPLFRASRRWPAAAPRCRRGRPSAPSPALPRARPTVTVTSATAAPRPRR